MIKYSKILKAAKKAAYEYRCGVQHAKKSIESDIKKIELLYQQARVPIRGIVRTATAIPLKALYMGVVWPVMMPVEVYLNYSRDTGNG